MLSTYFNLVPRLTTREVLPTLTIHIRGMVLSQSGNCACYITFHSSCFLFVFEEKSYYAQEPRLVHTAVVRTLPMSVEGLSDIIERKKGKKTEGRIKKHYMKTRQTEGDSYRISNTTNQRGMDLVRKYVLEVLVEGCR
jgi:hypothetical protein